jgi:hypothetical protein
VIGRCRTAVENTLFNERMPVPTLRERLAAVWQKVRATKAFVPTRLEFPPGAALVKDGHYFHVRVKRLFLADQRTFLKTHDPLVFAVTDFEYGAGAMSVPAVIGPAVVAKYLKDGNAPLGTLLVNTTVAGPFPFRGGSLALTVVLCKVRRDDFAGKILPFVEAAAGALDFSGAAASAIKLGEVVLGGIEALTGSDDTQPLVGMRLERNTNAGESVTEEVHALINAEVKPEDRKKFFVKDNELCFGDTRDTATSYRAADYVLVELTRTDERTVAGLPFTALYQRVKEEASQSGADSWKRAKANMLALWQAMVLSPDLIPTHRDKLFQGYKKETKEVHDEAERIKTLGPQGGRDSGTQAALNDAVSLLDL